jgi:ribosomal protein S12 methylthiotransferase accessory factor
MYPLTELLNSAAKVISEGPSPTDREDVRRLIESLNYGHPDPSACRHQASLLRSAAKLKRLFQICPPDAPGLVFFGGEADPSILGQKLSEHPVAGLAGSGLSLCKAFESCVGEGVEYLSQFDADGCPLEAGTVEEQACGLNPASRHFLATMLHHVGITPDQELAWISATRVCDGERVRFPVDVCLRRSKQDRNFAAPFKLGIGCAAGASFEDAARRALLELVERDAASLWWCGGRRGHPISVESEAGRAAADLIERLRQDNDRRISWLLDITTDIGVPCAAAISSMRNGYGFACGLAARTTMAEAVRAAIFEMCQSELAHAVVDAKRREAGDAVLNEADRRHLSRGTSINTLTCELLQPAGSPNRLVEPVEQDAKRELQAIVERVKAVGYETFAVDLARPIFGIPVVRILTPGLQLEPSEIVTGRLEQALGETGGGLVHTRDVALL